MEAGEPMPRLQPHGTWTSPITAQLVVTDARGIGGLQLDGDRLCWLEQRPDEGGRQVVVRHEPGGRTVDLTPPETDVRSRVHEYGGGAYLIEDGVLWFVEGTDQRVHRLELNGAAAPRPITPEPESPAGMRYADFVLTPDRRHLVCVRETHHGSSADQVVNEIVALPAGADATRPDNDDPALVLASGHDFYAAPRLSPDGRTLAYVRWDHPHMPWDATQVVVTDLDGMEVVTERVVAGEDREESALLPSWSVDGALHVITDRTGWWNLYRLDGNDMTNVVPAAVDLALPPWMLGQPGPVFLSDGRIGLVAVDRAVERPCLLDPAAGTLTLLSETHTTCRAMVGDGEAIWFVGASPTAFPEIARVHPGEGVEIIHRTRDLPVDAAWLPQPETVTFPTAGGSTAHAFVYPPTNPGHAGPPDERPPAIVNSHGGPTGHSPPALSLPTAYWTSRGFAVIDVNYRGSTGFGRDFRNALRGQWGVADVADCEAAARYLAARGDVDAARLLISGASAGGYTTLCALAFTDTFAAGASFFGVSDPALLAQETHKFESRYLDGLIGAYPDAIEAYRARSPWRHADQISCPVIVFQGLKDRVVPPSQAEAIIDALAQRGVPHAYVTFADEEHGFRKAANVVRCLDALLSFFLQVLDLPHPNELERVPLR